VKKSKSLSGRFQEGRVIGIKFIVTTLVNFGQDLRDRQDRYYFGIFNNAQATWRTRDFSMHFSDNPEER